MDKIIKDLLIKLETNNNTAYITGGFVRDKLLGINSYDIDITTSMEPNEIKKILNINTNIYYGSINIKHKKYNIDITTYREELNYNKRKPNIKYTKDINIDIKRRDFTINAILMDKNEKIIDLTNGINDLNKKIIRCIGDVNKKLTEDPLRILRAIRLYSIYDFNIDENIINFIKNNPNIVQNLSKYRIKQELDKMIKSKKLNGFKLIKELKLDKYLDIKYNELKVTNNILGIYAQIEFNNYNFKKEDKTNINKIKNILNIGKITNKTLFKYGLDINLIAGEILNIDKNEINDMYNNLKIKSKKDVKLHYKDIVNLKYVCYNNINSVYNDIIDNILENKLDNNKESIKEFLRKKE